MGLAGLLLAATVLDAVVVEDAAELELAAAVAGGEEELADWLESDDTDELVAGVAAELGCWACPPEAALVGGCAAAMPGNHPTIRKSQARRRIVRPASRYQSHETPHGSGACSRMGSATNPWESTSLAGYYLKRNSNLKSISI